jgi:hypothetical protein
MFKMHIVINFIFISHSNVLCNEQVFEKLNPDLGIMGSTVAMHQSEQHRPYISNIKILRVILGTNMRLDNPTPPPPTPHNYALCANEDENGLKQSLHLPWRTFTVVL